ncbi:MAG: RidA family protein [Ilumatobacteraceae bacterium]
MLEEVRSERVAQLDLPLPHGTRAGDNVYISGQIAMRPDGTLVVGDFDAEVRTVLDNVAAVVEAAGGTLADVCKTTVFLLNATLFEPMNRVYAEYFRAPLPARSTIVAPLSNPDLRIEIEAIAHIPVARG